MSTIYPHFYAAANTRIGTAENAHMSAMLRVLYLPTKSANRLSECSWILEPGFIDGVEVKPGVVLCVKPLLERMCDSDIEGLFEVVFYILDPHEERVVALRLDVPRPGIHLKCLAGATFSQDDGAVSLVDVLPRQRATVSEQCRELLLVGIVQ